LVAPSASVLSRGSKKGRCSVNQVSASVKFREALRQKAGPLAHVKIQVTTTEGEVFLVPWSERRSISSMDGTVEIPGLLAPRPVPKAMEILAPEPKIIFGTRKDGTRVKTGGYRPLFNDSLPNLLLRIGRIKFPPLRYGQDDPRLLISALADCIHDPNVALAYAEPTGLVLVHADGGWLGPWKKMGLQIEHGPKTTKRLKTLSRGFIFEKGFAAGDIAIKILADDDEHPTKVPGLDGRAKQMLLDGAFLISRSLADQVIDSVTDRHTPRWQEQRARGRATRLCNARVLVPAGTPGCEEGGLLKGNCIVVEDAEMYPGCHLVTHPCNIKTELKGWKAWHIGLEPQPPLSEVRTNVQAMLSLPQLFPTPEVMTWIDQEVYRVYASITEGKLLDTFERLSDRRLHGDIAPDELDSHLLWTRWAALDFFASGHDFRHSPALVEKLFLAHTKSMLFLPKGKVCIPVPCAVEEQVVSESMARLCGLELGLLQPGTIRRIAHYGFAVVSDQDWLEMNESHGGCDMDDHFMLFFRTIAGRKRVVVMRNPSDIGEYSVFEYVEGDPYPTFPWRTRQRDGSFAITNVAFPVADLTGAPKRTSEALRDGSLKVLGLPEGETIPDAAEEAYSRESVVAKDLARVLQGVNPGVYVNAKMVLNSVLGRQSETLLATMEDVIDACTQGGSVEAMKAIRTQAKAMIDEVIASGVPIDEALWKSRGSPALETQPPLIEGPLTKLIKHTQFKVSQGHKLLSAWAQTIHEVPPTLETYRTNAGDYAKMVKVLKDLRFESYQLHEVEVAGEKVDWQAFHAMVLDLVTPEQVGLFALVVHETPTTMTKKVTDGLLWNKAVFPHYLAALTKP
jgi:hypothetical protein